MKFPKHLLLDQPLNLNTSATSYWVWRFLNKPLAHVSEVDSLHLHHHFRISKKTPLLPLFLKQKNTLTLTPTWLRKLTRSVNQRQSFFTHFFTLRPKVKSRSLNSISAVFRAVNKVKTGSAAPDTVYIYRLLTKPRSRISGTHHQPRLQAFFDINFLRKERIYTKLKYSRVPQYDAVSGGAAVLLAGLLGFLICEKFGFEMVDSGDFFFLFMYLVFFCFILRLLLKGSNVTESRWSLISLKWFFFFYSNILLTLLAFFKDLCFDK